MVNFLLPKDDFAAPVPPRNLHAVAPEKYGLVFWFFSLCMCVLVFRKLQSRRQSANDGAANRDVNKYLLSG